MKTGIIILSAGGSSRLGRPKQLLEYDGNNLLQTAIDAAKGTGFSPIVLVLGAYAEQILTSIPKNDVEYVINNNWETGMSTSIKVGMSRILELEGDLQNVIFMVSDQPFVSTSLLKSLSLEKGCSDKNIVACKYSGTLGVPALFNFIYFNELMSLKGDAGAKKVLTQNYADVSSVDFDLGGIDIDSQTDYDNLNKR